MSASETKAEVCNAHHIIIIHLFCAMPTISSYHLSFCAMPTTSSYHPSFLCCPSLALQHKSNHRSIGAAIQSHPPYHPSVPRYLSPALQHTNRITQALKRSHTKSPTTSSICSALSVSSSPHKSHKHTRSHTKPYKATHHIIHLFRAVRLQLALILFLLWCAFNRVLVVCVRIAPRTHLLCVQ